MHRREAEWPVNMLQRAADVAVRAIVSVLVCLSLTHRAKGQGELYIYAPLTDNNKRQFLDVPPKSSTNNDYGFSVGRGAFTLESAKGRWTTVALRIKLNDMGAENGNYCNVKRCTKLIFHRRDTALD